MIEPRPLAAHFHGNELPQIHTARDRKKQSRLDTDPVMPKGKGKKKGKGKGKGDKKAAGGPPPPEIVAEEPLDDLSKQFYLIQIRDLEERLGRYQAKCDKLRLENQELQDQLRQQVEDQEQMIAFLKRKNQEQAEQYVDLEEKLMALQQAKESEKERLEQQITQMKEDSQRALDQVLAPPTHIAPIQTLLHGGKVEISDSFLLFFGEEGLGMNVGTYRVGTFPVLHIYSGPQTFLSCVARRVWGPDYPCHQVSK